MELLVDDSQAPLRHRVAAGTVASFRTWRGSRPSLAQDPAISGEQLPKIKNEKLRNTPCAQSFCAPYYNITAPIMQPQGTNSLVPIVTRTQIGRAHV